MLGRGDPRIAIAVLPLGPHIEQNQDVDTTTLFKRVTVATTTTDANRLGLCDHAG